MKERQFVTELKHSFQKHDAHFHKIIDMPHFTGQRTRFDIKKPFDILIAYKGTPIAIEAKIIKKYQAFGAQIKKHQKEALTEYSKHGHAFIFLNVRIPRKTNHLIIFDWAQYSEIFKTRTIKKNELELMPYLPGAKGIYNLKGFLRSVADCHERIMSYK